MYDDIVADDRFDDEDGDKKIYQQWWFWAGSIGVVGIVAASIAVASGGGDSGTSGFQTEVTW